MAACVLLPNASEEFYEKLKGEVPLLLEHNESRIRIAAGIYMYIHVYMYIHKLFF